MNTATLIQLLLTILGFAIPDEERQNGEFGEGTREAVRQFQGLLALPTTGEVDEATATAIVALTCQHILVMQGFEISEDDLWRATIGDSTREAIRRFQAQQRLDRSGELDEETWDAVQAHAGSGRFSVTGKVTDSAGNPFTSGAVQALDVNVDTGARTLLGEVQSAADGSYKIEYTVKQVRELGKLRADLIVIAQDSDGALQAQVGPILRAPVHAPVDLVVELAPPLPQTFVVRGQILDASGPRNGVQISLYDRDLFFRREAAETGQLLGTEVTKREPAKDTDGWFEITYAPEHFARGDIGRESEVIPDLIFALSRDGAPLDTFQIYRLPDGKAIAQESLVSDDDLIMGIQARRVEEVRIVLEGGEPKRELSEYERLIRAIAPMLPETAEPGLDAGQIEALVGAATQRFDEEKHRDMSFVARETGFDQTLIQALAAAFRLAATPFQNQLPAHVFYGLARAEGATDVLALGRLSTEDLRAALLKASTGMPLLIPAFESLDHLKGTVRTIRDVLARYVPSYRPAPGVPSLADLMGSALPEAQDQATLWRTLSDHTGTPAEFWKELKSQPGFDDADKITRVQYGFQLGLLAQNNLTLINAIRDKHPTVFNPVELAFQLDTQKKWSELLNDEDLGIAIPDDVPGKPAERKANYAASLAGAMQIAHPGAAIANMIASLPPEHLENAQPAVARFLTDAVRTANFDLVADRIDELVAQHGESLLAGIEEKDRPIVIDQVKRLQRLFRLSTGLESMKALLDAGFNSARELAELPPDIAMEILGPVLGEIPARLVLNRARNISAAAIHQYVFLNDAINGDIPGGAI